jgi:hypothetical protein
VTVALFLISIFSMLAPLVSASLKADQRNRAGTGAEFHFKST